MKNIASFDTLMFLKSLGASETAITFDSLTKGLVGLDGQDEIEKDSIAMYEQYADDVLITLDSLGVDEKTINAFVGKDDEKSLEAGALIAKSIDTNFDEADILEFCGNLDMQSKKQNIEFDSVPERKAGYKRTLVVRNGKKVWVNKRNPNKKVILSPAQKRALAKARLKAHTGMAERKRHLSNKKRLNFKMS